MSVLGTLLEHAVNTFMQVGAVAAQPTDQRPPNLTGVADQAFNIGQFFVRQRLPTLRERYVRIALLEQQHNLVQCKPRCPPCRVIEPILNNLAADYAGRLLIAKLNTDEHQRIMVQLGVLGIPTLVIFKNGREVERLVGARTKRHYQQRFDALLHAAG